MKHSALSSICLILICIFQVSMSVAQKDSVEVMKKLKVVPIPVAKVESSFKELQRNVGWRLLTEKLTSLKFSSKLEKGSMVGFNASVTTRDNRSLKGTFLQYEFRQPGSTEAAVMIHVSDGTEEYAALAITKSGEWDDIVEWTLEGSGKNQKVVLTHSWSSCMKSHLAHATTGCTASLSAAYLRTSFTGAVSLQVADRLTRTTHSIVSSRTGAGNFGKDRIELSTIGLYNAPIYLTLIRALFSPFSVRG